MSSPIIQIRDLTIELSGNPILNSLSLDIGEGEYVSIVGPNGAGKTTLIKCMAGIHPGWSGTIEIGGRPFSSYSARERARLQSYVPQAEGRTNPLTVEEFVATGRYPHLSAFTTMNAEDYSAIDTALDQAGLQHLRNRSMNTLSGGEWQMAFIAAALAQQTGILLLDEPSTFLDYRHQTDVSSLLRKACRDDGITVVSVHHDFNTATACSDRIYALKNGEIAFSGTAEEAVNVEVLKSIYDTEFICTPTPDRTLPIIISGGAL
jgi:iron complex transport system ATP-binding protein